MTIFIERKNKKTDKVEKKAYETVAERVRKFREVCPIQDGWALLTEITFPDKDKVLAQATIKSPDGGLIATGTAEENRNAGYINKTSAVENAETSAIGRCLFAAGFGGGEFCSAEELQNALAQQKQIKAAELKIVNGQKNKPKPPQQQAETKGKNKPKFEFGPTISGITYTKRKNLIIAEGKTFQSKGLLKSSGFNWNPEEKAWAKEA
ncbi:hypothetical protein BuS5_04013 (plasmid) [Desulfosarcina sp. BuS5]|uniref:hypothetical protein n=1 Tax=Desulfosarcina sp. BuS5 TaxID=933262 RepID=UPI0004816952|nr:hypothetical protein [Desulfosarcina sp. BuS5]WDN91041.1 hypothetical protein BuS5_04013 [Desulfosarcina sp. BuS5]